MLASVVDIFEDVVTVVMVESIVRVTSVPFGICKGVVASGVVEPATNVVNTWLIVAVSAVVSVLVIVETGVSAAAVDNVGTRVASAFVVVDISDGVEVAVEKVIDGASVLMLEVEVWEAIVMMVRAEVVAPEVTTV